MVINMAGGPDTVPILMRFVFMKFLNNALTRVSVIISLNHKFCTFCLCPFWCQGEQKRKCGLVWDYHWWTRKRIWDVHRALNFATMLAMRAYLLFASLVVSAHCSSPMLFVDSTSGSYLSESKEVIDMQSNTLSALMSALTGLMPSAVDEDASSVVSLLLPRS
jgi:hypothetical protein